VGVQSERRARRREPGAIEPALLVLTVLLGVFPQPAIAIISPSVQRILAIATDASQVVLK